MLYLIQNLTTNEVKMGFSRNPQKRLKQLQTGSGGRLRLLKTYQVDDDKVWEQKLHKMLWQSKSRGEWFLFEPLEDYLQLIDEFLPQRVPP